jgi:tRNA-dihydrouridine synthase
VPVLGNGDIWTAEDAVAMVERTGCAGVVVGRACLGRPWFFGQLADAFAGRPVRPEPPLGEVAALAADHARLLVAAIDEDRGMRMMRKHLAWYVTGFPVGPAARKRLTSVSTLAELDDALGALDQHLTVETGALGQPRGTQAGPHAVVVPDGWLDAEATAPPDRLADVAVSGG